MLVTKADYLNAMAGMASEDVVSAVIAELTKHDTPISLWLASVQAWSNERFPSAVRLSWPRQLPEDTLDGDSAGDKPNRFPRGARRGMIEDYLLCLAGHAPVEVVNQVCQAMSEPDSELSGLLRDMAKPRLSTTVRLAKLTRLPNIAASEAPSDED
jgi:hypothetical protein